MNLWRRPWTVAALLFGTTAFGADKAVCFDSASKGQSLRAAHELVEAREQFVICAAATCPALVRTDCANWLAEVDKTLPSVVVTAKNAEGADLVDVRVSIDGKPFLTKLDGLAVPTNPGQHTLHFEAPDGASLDQLVVIHEGEKNEHVGVVLGARTASTPGGESAGASPLRQVGWWLGGVGIAGLATGAVLGVLAIVDTKDAHCNASKQCLAGPLGDARTAATASDIALIAGGVLFAMGASFVLVGHPTTHEAPVGTVAIGPIVGPGHVGLTLTGTF
jgi:hypothetical protein